MRTNNYTFKNALIDTRRELAYTRKQIRIDIRNVKRFARNSASELIAHAFGHPVLMAVWVGALIGLGVCGYYLMVEAANGKY